MHYTYLGTIHIDFRGIISNNSDRFVGYKVPNKLEVGWLHKLRVSGVGLCVPT